MDDSPPHTLAAVANMAPIVTEMISMAEIATLVFLAQKIVADPQCNHHKIIPVSFDSQLDTHFAFY